MAELQEAFFENDVVFVSAQTGAAKTTQVPQHVLSFLDWEGRVYVTQPRSIPSASLAQRVADELDVELGQEVGYQYRFHRQFQKTVTKLLFCTEGTLVMKMRNDPLLQDAKCVILDEAHERTLEVDLLMLFLRDAVVARKGTDRPLKVIVMSATAERERFVTYFRQDQLRCAIVDIPGRTFPIEVRYRSQPTAEPVIEAVRTVATIADTRLYRVDMDDILVFVSTRKEIERCLVNTRKLVSPKKVVAVGLSSDSSEAEKTMATATLASELGAKRKVIFATNVAETSLTIPTVRHVVDTGRAFLSGFDPESGFEFLRNGWISKANARQRIGRAGRVQPGVAYLMYTEEEWNALPDYAPPGIHRTEMTENILQLMVLEATEQKEKENEEERDNEETEDEDEEEMPIRLHDLVNNVLRRLIDPPSTLAIGHAQRQLLRLGAIDGDSYLTQVGERLAKMSMYGLGMARALLVSPYFDVTEEMMTLAAVTNVFAKFEDMFDADNLDAVVREKRRQWGGNEILAALTLVQEWNQVRRDKEKEEVLQWIKDQQLVAKKWTTLGLVLGDLRRQLRSFTPIKPTYLSFPLREAPAEERWMRCLLQGFVSQVALRREPAGPRHPTWQVIGTKRPIDVGEKATPYMLFLEATDVQNRLLGAFCAPISDPRWIAESLQNAPRSGIPVDHPDAVWIETMIKDLPKHPIALLYYPKDRKKLRRDPRPGMSESESESDEVAPNAPFTPRGRWRFA